MSLPTRTFRTVCTDPRCTTTGTCWRVANERYGDAPGENYGPRCVPVRATLHGTVRPNLAPPATIDAPARPLTNDDLARAYDMGRDMERADTVAWLREAPALRHYADCIERGEHRRSPSTSPTGRPEPEPVPDALALGKRIVACRGWRWTEGMRAIGRRTMPTAWFRLEEWTASMYGEWADAVPDLDDAATLGCILARLREVALDPSLYVCMDGGDPQTGVWFVRWGNNASRRGRTEAEALVRAWEALS